MDFESIELSEWVYILHPRPVAIVIAGTWNDYSAMPASWIMPVSRKPPMVAIAISKKRFTYHYIVERREFAICILSYEYLKNVHFLGSVSGKDIRDKIVAAGLTKIKSRKIEVPVVGESMVIAECKLRNIIESGDHDIIVGEIIDVYKKKGIEIPNPKSYRIPLHVLKNMYTRAIESIDIVQ